jgi:hypothetical protein
MTSRLVELCIGARDPGRLAVFWAGVLGWESDRDSHGSVALLPNDDTGFRIRFCPTRNPRSARTRCIST